MLVKVADQRAESINKIDRLPVGRAIILKTQINCKAIRVHETSKGKFNDFGEVQHRP